MTDPEDTVPGDETEATTELPTVEAPAATVEPTADEDQPAADTVVPPVVAPPVETDTKSDPKPAEDTAEVTGPKPPLHFVAVAKGLTPGVKLTALSTDGIAQRCDVIIPVGDATHTVVVVVDPNLPAFRPQSANISLKRVVEPNWTAAACAVYTLYHSRIKK